MNKNLANTTTFTRILLVPLFISLFLLDKLDMATLVFSLAALTDGLDGYLARHFNQTSSLGAWLDPLADKLMMISALILLLPDPRFNLLMIPTIIIICREVLVSALREWMAILGKQEVMKVSLLAKWKTATQMFAVFFLLVSKSHPEWTTLLLIAYSVFYIATFFTIASLVIYLYGVYKSR